MSKREQLWVICICPRCRKEHEVCYTGYKCPSTTPRIYCDSCRLVINGYTGYPEFHVTKARSNKKEALI